MWVSECCLENWSLRGVSRGPGRITMQMLALGLYLFYLPEMKEAGVGAANNQTGLFAILCVGFCPRDGRVSPPPSVRLGFSVR